MTIKTFQALISSESVEWFTPPSITNLASAFLGGIDIDPATCEQAQSWIKAKTYYTQETNGITKSWLGKLWLNPPYGRKSATNHGASAWMLKALEEFKCGNVSEGLILVRGDSQGMKSLLSYGFAFVECKRIAFISAEDPSKNSPVPGTKIIYLGHDVQRFKEYFQILGICLRAY
jgi:hypothetical protein